MKLLNKIEASEKLMAGDRDRFTFRDSESGVSKATFRSLHSRLKPLRGGLFPREMSQTFVWM